MPQSDELKLTDSTDQPLLEIARRLAARLIPHTTSVHNVRLISRAIDEAVAAERRRCAAIARRIGDNCSDFASACGYVREAIENGG